MAQDASSHPVGGVDYPRTLREFDEWFSSEKACADYLRRLRWGSALGLQRVLGLGSYQTAWAWLRKLRSAMARERLRGRVEGDETYVGGVEPGVHGRQTETKSVVAVAAEEDGRGIGRVRLRRVEDVAAGSPFVRDVVEPGSEVGLEPGSLVAARGAQAGAPPPGALPGAGVTSQATRTCFSLRRDSGGESLPAVEDRMHRRLRLLATSTVALLFTTGTALTIYAGYFRMFFFFGHWDDEGYMLVSLRSFRAIGALYSEVYSQYGPLYFVVMDLLFNGMRLPVTHDTGRLVTLGLWAATGLVGGVAVWRLTRSVGLGLCAQLLVFRSLFVLHSEPMHPGGLLCFLLICLATVPLLYPSRPRLAAALLGAAGAGLAMVKINVGAFALLAAGFFYVASLPALARRRTLVIGAGLALAAAPLALMAPALDQPWAQRYALHIAAAALAVALAVGSLGPDERFRPGQLAWCAGGVAGLALPVCAAVLLRGTSPGDLFDALLVRPFGQAGHFTLPMQLPPHSRKGALLALGLCVTAVVSRRSGRWRGTGADLLEGLLRAAAGLAMAVTASGLFLISPLGFLTAPLAWIAALGPREMECSPAALTVARRLLPPLAVLQTLHAYPVAGSQVQWSSFLLIPLGAICVADGARQLARAVRPLRLATPGWPRRLAGAAAVLVLLAMTLRGLQIQLQYERGLYESNVPLGLPGAARLRIPAAEAETLRAITADLRQGCSTHVSLPGLNSFYLWAEHEPPTAANATSWMYLFDAPLQARIVDRLRGIDRLCGVYSPDLAQFWTQGRPVPPGPLLDYFSDALTPAGQHGPYTFLVRRTRP